MIMLISEPLAQVLNDWPLNNKHEWALNANLDHTHVTLTRPMSRYAKTPTTPSKALYKSDDNLYAK